MSGARSTSTRAGAKAAPGYCGKPLRQKLGLRPGLRVRLRHAPAQHWDWCGFDAANATTAGASARGFDFGHVFVSTRAQLAAETAPGALGPDAGAMCGFPGRRSPRG